MEKLTPTKFSAVKAVSGTNDKGAYAFNSIGFLTREHGDKKWFNLAFKGDNPLKEGTAYELEVTERPYKGKDGTDKVAYNVKFPSKESEMSKAIMRHELQLSKLEARIAKLEEGPNIPVINEYNEYEDERPIPDDESLLF